MLITVYTKLILFIFLLNVIRTSESFNSLYFCFISIYIPHDIFTALICVSLPSCITISFAFYPFLQPCCCIWGYLPSASNTFFKTSSRANCSWDIFLIFICLLLSLFCPFSLDIQAWRSFALSILTTPFFSFELPRLLLKSRLSA